MTLFGLGAVGLVIVGLVALLVEVVTLWAAVALANGPETRLTKTSWLAPLMAVVWVPATLLICYQLGLAKDPLDTESLAVPLLAAGLSLLIQWVVAALLAVPLLPVSVPKGMLVGVLQLLLRIFLIVLIVAVVMVVLAVLQIARRSDVRPGTSLTPPTHATTRLS
jgi:hypothetical protein